MPRVVMPRKCPECSGPTRCEQAMTTESRLTANALDATYAALDREQRAAGPVAENPDHWSNWQTRGDGYGDTACGMQLKKGD